MRAGSSEMTNPSRVHSIRDPVARDGQSSWFV
jgi:hypothetical protein